MFIFYFIFGCLGGSFFDCQVERLTKNIPLLTKRSFCFHCRHPLSFWDLIPLFSQLILKGKCRYCDQVIPKSHLLSEILCGCLGVLYFFQIISFQQLILCCALYFISFCDIRSKSFPLVLWLIPFMLLLPSTTFSLFTLLFLLFSVLSQKINIGIGSGDFLAISLISFDLQLEQLLWLIQLASFLAIIYFSFKKKNESIPFVPFLSVSYLIILSSNFLF
ncbi:prepilin peptidase [Enterococcus sp. MMGLQ5-2]|nr:prepilin peptidase [Enterococcus sp. MMGLQ5-2]MBS7585212.1 prepilin peptidase [Enterococcus sp. MMGLQ5-1]NPD13069.1 prepilin peptidase [Enterococcus sp. MMGLQ5-1]NPD37757.1 prepilin peptidase [Enterococcus sp. MMGLQ5-2]